MKPRTIMAYAATLCLSIPITSTLEFEWWNAFLLSAGLMLVFMNIFEE